MKCSIAVVLVWLVACSGFAAAPASEALVEKGNAAFKKGAREQAIELFSEAARIDPSNHVAFWNRGRVHENAGRLAEAIPDFNIVLTLITNHPGAFQLRGMTWLRLGKPEKALSDFDRYIELSPTQARHHWQRGIALYLLGRYGEAEKQYVGCHRANTNDIENVLWHFACRAKQGVQNVKLLPAGKDPRPGLADLYAFYNGKGTTNAVAKANPVLGDFYLGLYYDATGKQALGRDHIRKAAEQAKTGDFIGAVAKTWRQE